MYKDQDKQREANKAIKRNARQKGVTKGVTKEGVTEKALKKPYVTLPTRIEYIQGELDPWTVKGIESAARLFEDRDRRYEKAYKYKLWHDDYLESHPMGTLSILSH